VAVTGGEVDSRQLKVRRGRKTEAFQSEWNYPEQAAGAWAISSAVMSMFRSADNPSRSRRGLFGPYFIIRKMKKVLKTESSAGVGKRWGAKATA
jgi:hypothetical protein